MTVAVVGLGYVGLPTALGCWRAGASIIGLDSSAQRLHDIRTGAVDLLPDQHATLACARAGAGIGDGFLLTSDAGALRRADAVVICVPTPVTADQEPDPAALRAACACVVDHAVADQLIVLTSTSQVGTTRALLLEPLAARGLVAEENVLVAFAPERIDPGNERHRQEDTPRIVGGAGPRSSRAAARLLASTASSVHRVADPETAEMAKLWENVFRAVNIALANELSDACLHLGVPPLAVIEAAASKPYGFMPFFPGPGAGGHCIPCDPYYLLGQLPVQSGAAPAASTAAPVLSTAMAALRDRPVRVARLAAEALQRSGVAVPGARVLVLGVAYKEGVSDVRESPALRILALLAAQGAEVAYSDPRVPTVTVDGVVLGSVPEPGALPWDLVIVHTAHPGWDLSWLDAVPGPRVLDTRFRRAWPAPVAVP